MTHARTARDWPPHDTTEADGGDKSAAPAVIQLRDVEYGYPNGEFRLRVADRRVNPGDRIAVVGPSGSGKTTLLNLMSGLLLPTSGTVEILGFRTDRLTHDERQELRLLRIGLVFQEFELLDHLGALDNVLLPYRLSPDLVLDRASREKARELLSEAGLGEKLDRHPANLSQGERQRVAVARALVTSPAIVLGDEPTGNLDTENRDRVVAMLFRHVAETGAPLILATHDSELIQRFAKTIDLGAGT